MQRTCHTVSKVSKGREHFDFDVSEKQHSELLELVRSVYKKGSKDIEQLCDEGEHVLGVESPLREVWQQDVIE